MDTHIVTGSTSFISNVLKCVQRAGLEALGVVFEPLASAAATLLQEEKQVGVVLLDIGGGTTDIAVYSLGSAIYTATIPGRRQRPDQRHLARAENDARRGRRGQEAAWPAPPGRRTETLRRTNARRPRDAKESPTSRTAADRRAARSRNAAAWPSKRSSKASRETRAGRSRAYGRRRAVARHRTRSPKKSSVCRFGSACPRAIGGLTEA